MPSELVHPMTGPTPPSGSAPTWRATCRLPGSDLAELLDRLPDPSRPT
jgi:hypothetical protein